MKQQNIYTEKLRDSTSQIDDKGILKDNDQKLRKSAREHFYTAYFKYILQSSIRKKIKCMLFVVETMNYLLHFELNMHISFCFLPLINL